MYPPQRDLQEAKPIFLLYDRVCVNIELYPLIVNLTNWGSPKRLRGEFSGRILIYVPTSVAIYVSGIVNTVTCCHLSNLSQSLWLFTGCARVIFYSSNVLYSDFKNGFRSEILNQLLRIFTRWISMTFDTYYQRSDQLTSTFGNGAQQKLFYITGLLDSYMVNVPSPRIYEKLSKIGCCAGEHWMF